MQTLDLAALAKETEGYTPQDLAVLLERAVHANVVHRGDAGGGTAAFFLFNKFKFRKYQDDWSVSLCLSLVSDLGGLRAGP